MSIFWILAFIAIPVILFIAYAVQTSMETPRQRVYSSPQTPRYHSTSPSGYIASAPTNYHEAPRIAYKRAFLLASAEDEERYFSGVANIQGTGYGPDADAIPGTPGFHAYRDFRDAAQHIQRGNVLLEVVLSGKIEEHELGYTATHQRVLQIIFDQCALCSLEVTHFSYHPLLDTVALFCTNHYEQSVAMLHNGELHSNPNFRPTYGVIDGIHTVLPWIAEHNIITATRKGEKKFIPTVISDSSNA